MFLCKSNERLIINTLLAVIFLFTNLISAQPKTESQKNEYGRFDTGKMWAFDFPPLDYFEETYGFRPTEEWLEDVRLSGLRIPGCTASFVSEDGLIMTNNHCSDGPRVDVQKEGEDLARDGFYAPSLEDERKVPDFYADQLVFMKDVTEEIQSAIDEGNTEKEKIENKDAKIEELKEKYEDETGLRIELVTFFNDSRFSIYGYKRYNDVRVVFLPENDIAYFGGDYDNFTYPRYNLDCAFYRIYEDDKPVKSKNFFQWSDLGAQKDEVLFTVGNPGTTNRLKTVSQLKYLRDVVYGNLAFVYDGNYKAFEYYKSVFPEKADELEKFRTNIGNGQKVLTRIVEGLKEPDLLMRKADFEDKLKDAVKNDSRLYEKYGKIWETIDRTSAEITGYNNKLSIYDPSSRRVYPVYFSIARKLIKLAEQLDMEEEERDEQFKEENLEEYISSIFPENYNELFEKIKLSVFVDLAFKNLGSDDYITKNIFEGKRGMQAADLLISKTIINNKETVEKLAGEGSSAILNSHDVFINFLLSKKDEVKELEKLEKESNDTENVSENLLGQLMFEIFGTSIPPDANFTLRISDGVLKDFEYNGTVAPLKTTFFGLYDRYYSFDKEYPWDLPERWKSPSEDFNLSTPFNFISTHDAVGGSSGSPVINKNAEIVGLAFDGNVKSIIGNFLYIEEENRNVAVASQAMIEAFKNLYGFHKLADELVNGKLPE